MRKKVSYKVALGGIVSALSLVAMIMSGVIPGLEYAIPAFAGIVLVIIVIEIGMSWAFLTYAGVALLSFFVVPNKEASLLFITFMGYYPIIKSVFETKIKARPLQWFVKIILFNIALVVYYNLVMLLVSSPELKQSIDEIGKFALPLLIGAANVVFVIYDIAVTNLITMYIKWFRKKVIRHLDK
ncbi:MAG: hypothetical protein J6A55_05325 [Oscillospiraceae bacterium]|nr:hypothetical protein [Oscillospiraceae bacterium]